MDSGVKPPTELVIDGQKVSVRWVKELGDFPQGYGVGGDYDRVKQAIRVTTNVPTNSQRGQLFHEILHHLAQRGGLAKRFSRKQEESIIDSLDSWIVRTLRDNPDLVAWLVAP